MTYGRNKFVMDNSLMMENKYSPKYASRVSLFMKFVHGNMGAQSKGLCTYWDRLSVLIRSQDEVKDCLLLN